MPPRTRSLLAAALVAAASAPAAAAPAPGGPALREAPEPAWVEVPDPPDRAPASAASAVDAPAAATTDAGEEPSPTWVDLSEVPYRAPAAFLDAHAEWGSPSADLAGDPADGRQVGVGIGLMTALRSNIQLEGQLDWRRLDVSLQGIGDLETRHVLDLLLGGRVYPRRPTVALGSLAIRVTAAGAGGLVVGEGVGDLAIKLSGGASVTFDDDPSALLVEVVYRPIGTSIDTSGAGTLDVDPTWSVQLGFLFGPGAR